LTQPEARPPNDRIPQPAFQAAERAAHGIKKLFGDRRDSFKLFRSEQCAQGGSGIFFDEFGNVDPRTVGAKNWEAFSASLRTKGAFGAAALKRSHERYLDRSSTSRGPITARVGNLPEYGRKRT
jgi:hypothetical protein